MTCRRMKNDPLMFKSLAGTKLAYCSSEDCRNPDNHRYPQDPNVKVWSRTIKQGGGWECTSCRAFRKTLTDVQIPAIPNFFGRNTSTGKPTARSQRYAASRVNRKQGEREFKRFEHRLDLKHDYEAGMSFRAMGRKYGLCYVSLWRYVQRMKRLNWVHKPKKKRRSRAKTQPQVVAKSLSPEDLRRIRQLGGSE